MLPAEIGGMAGQFFAALMIAGAVPAGAVLPSGHRLACYQAAEFGWPTRNGLDVCTEALRDPKQSLHDRGATLVNRGIVQLHARRYAAAVADFDAALVVAPGLAEALANKGIALVDSGHPVDALDLLTAALAANPARPEVVYYSRGLANEEVGAMRAAYDDYTAAAALAPDWTEPAEQLRRFTVTRRPTARG